MYFYTTLILKKVRLKLTDCLHRLMMSLHHPKLYVEIDFDDLKVAIVTSNDQVKKNLKIPNCKICWMKILLKHLKNWLNSSMLTSQQYPDIWMGKKENSCHISWTKTPLQIDQTLPFFWLWGTEKKFLVAYSNSEKKITGFNTTT